VPNLSYTLLGALLALVACTPPSPSAPSGSKEGSSQAASPAPSSEPVALEINGFNYTDLYIDSFEVNGQGGGNLFVSTPDSGGGKGVCCASWRPDSKAPVKVTIKWTRDQKRWCEQDVSLTGPVPSHPRHLGVHFFPDGHIEAELAEDYPALKFQWERARPDARKASGNSVADERLSRCKNGY
jgi:hypothetical protein